MAKDVVIVEAMRGRKGRRSGLRVFRGGEVTTAKVKTPLGSKRKVKDQN